VARLQDAAAREHCDHGRLGQHGADREARARPTSFVLGSGTHSAEIALAPSSTRIKS
jgi:hypothetical protein